MPYIYSAANSNNGWVREAMRKQHRAQQNAGCGVGLLIFVLGGFGCLAPTWFVVMINALTLYDNHEYDWYRTHGKTYQATVLENKEQGDFSGVISIRIAELDKLAEISVNNAEFKDAHIGTVIDVWVAGDRIHIARTNESVNPRIYFLLLIPVLSALIGFFLIRKAKRLGGAGHANMSTMR